MDSTCLLAAPTALYTNAAPPTARSSSSMPSHPLSGGNISNGGHQNKNNNKNRNGGHGGGNNGSGDRNSSSGQTTIPTAFDGRTGTPWPTYGHPWPGHMIVYPDPVPTGQQCPQAFMATPGPYPSLGFLPSWSPSSAITGVSLITLPPESSSCRTTHSSGCRVLTRPHKMVKLNVLFVRLTMSSTLY
jgi:hypothetical protein